MKTPKYAILETLSEMDNLEAEKVLSYIKTLAQTRKPEATAYDKFKAEAMSEIRRALKGRGVEVSF